MDRRQFIDLCQDLIIIIINDDDDDDELLVDKKGYGN